MSGSRRLDHLVQEVRHVAVLEFPDRKVDNFYKVLGFDEVVHREDPPREYIEALTGGNLADLKIRKVANRHNQILEILSLPSVNIPTGGAWNHFAISVADCNLTIEQLTLADGVVVGGPVASPDGPFLVAYVRDASGNLVELVEQRVGP